MITLVVNGRRGKGGVELQGPYHHVLFLILISSALPFPSTSGKRLQGRNRKVMIYSIASGEAQSWLQQTRTHEALKTNKKKSEKQ